jgi:hypothetical protein
VSAPVSAYRQLPGQTHRSAPTMDNAGLLLRECLVPISHPIKIWLTNKINRDICLMLKQIL